MYLDLWKQLYNQAYRVRTSAELRTLMQQMEQRMLDEAKFERQPHKALRHLRRINTIGMEDAEMVNISSIEG